MSARPYCTTELQIVPDILISQTHSSCLVLLVFVYRIAASITAVTSSIGMLFPSVVVINVGF